MDLKLELTMEQKFKLKMYEVNLKEMDQHQKDELIVMMARQLFIKDNVVKQLMKEVVNNEGSKIEQWLSEQQES